MSISTFIPKNAKTLLRNTKLFRQYALSPYGLTSPKTSNFPKKHPQYKFFQHEMILHRPVFKLKNQQLSKPEIKQYLEKLYGLKIAKVNTVRFMGRVVRNYARRPKLVRGFKKAFVITQHKIPDYLNQPIL